MSLWLYYHPLSSFCQKVLTALYEHATPFEGEIVDLGDATSRAAFLAIWPIGRFPVLRDEGRGETVPESTIIIEHLDLYHPGAVRLIPQDPALALETRARDRFFDLYVNVPMQKIVTDRLRPPGQGDAVGVAQARGLLATAYDLIERDMAGRTWATGDDVSMADCAAAPALYYANLVAPFALSHPTVGRYFERLMQRPSFRRVVDEAAPYRHLFPSEPGN